LPFLVKVSIFRLTEEASSRVKSFSGQKTVPLCELVAFCHNLPVLVLDELTFGLDGLFILGLRLVVAHVVTEDTDEDGDVNDGEEHP